MWKEHNGVGDPGGPGGWNVTFVIPVMLHCGPNIESMGTMGVPRFTILCTIMNNDFASCGGHGGFIVVEHTMDLVIGAEFWVISGHAE